MSLRRQRQLLAGTGQTKYTQQPTTGSVEIISAGIIRSTAGSFYANVSGMNQTLSSSTNLNDNTIWDQISGGGATGNVSATPTGGGVLETLIIGADTWTVDSGPGGGVLLLNPTDTQTVIAGSGNRTVFQGSFDLETNDGEKALDFSGTSGDLHLEDFNTTTNESNTKVLFDRSSGQLYMDPTSATLNLPTSDNNKVMRAGGLEIGYTSLGHSSHPSGNTEEGLIALGYDNTVISQLPLNVETTDSNASETFIKSSSSGEVIFSLSNTIQGGDARPITSTVINAAGYQNATQVTTAINNALSGIDGSGYEGQWPATFASDFTLDRGSVWLNDGELWYYIGSTLTIDSTGDLNTLEPTSNNALWEQISGAAGGGLQVISAFSQITSPTNGQDVYLDTTDGTNQPGIYQYNSTDSEWVLVIGGAGVPFGNTLPRVAGTLGELFRLLQSDSNYQLGFYVRIANTGAITDWRQLGEERGNGAFPTTNLYDGRTFYLEEHDTSGTNNDTPGWYVYRTAKAATGTPGQSGYQSAIAADWYVSGQSIEATRIYPIVGANFNTATEANAPHAEQFEVTAGIWSFYDVPYVYSGLPHDIDTTNDLWNGSPVEPGTTTLRSGWILLDNLSIPVSDEFPTGPRVGSEFFLDVAVSRTDGTNNRPRGFYTFVQPDSNPANNFWQQLSVSTVGQLYNNARVGDVIYLQFPENAFNGGDDFAVGFYRAMTTAISTPFHTVWESISGSGSDVKVNGTTITDPDFRSDVDAIQHRYAAEFNVPSGTSNVGVQIDYDVFNRENVAFTALQADVNEIFAELAQHTYTWEEDNQITAIFITERSNKTGSASSGNDDQLDWTYRSSTHELQAYAHLTDVQRDAMDAFVDQGLIVGLGPSEPTVIPFRVTDWKAIGTGTTTPGIGTYLMHLTMVGPDEPYYSSTTVTNASEFESWSDYNVQYPGFGYTQYFYRTTNNDLAVARYDSSSAIVGSALTPNERLVVDGLVGVSAATNNGKIIQIDSTETGGVTTYSYSAIDGPNNIIAEYPADTVLSTGVKKIIGGTNITFTETTDDEITINATLSGMGSATLTGDIITVDGVSHNLITPSQELDIAAAKTKLAGIDNEANRVIPVGVGGVTVLQQAGTSNWEISVDTATAAGTLTIPDVPNVVTRTGHVENVDDDFFAPLDNTYPAANYNAQATNSVTPGPNEVFFETSTQGVATTVWEDVVVLSVAAPNTLVSSFNVEDRCLVYFNDSNWCLFEVTNVALQDPLRMGVTTVGSEFGGQAAPGTSSLVGRIVGNVPGFNASSVLKYQAADDTLTAEGVFSIVSTGMTSNGTADFVGLDEINSIKFDLVQYTALLIGVGPDEITTTASNYETNGLSYVHNGVTYYRLFASDGATEILTTDKDNPTTANTVYTKTY